MNIARTIAGITAAILTAPALAAGRSSVNWDDGMEGGGDVGWIAIVALVGGGFLGYRLLLSSVGKAICEKLGDVGAMLLLYGTPIALGMLMAMLFR